MWQNRSGKSITKPKLAILVTLVACADIADVNSCGVTLKEVL